MAFKTTCGFGLFNLRMIDFRQSFAFWDESPTLSQMSNILPQSSVLLSSSGVTLSSRKKKKTQISVWKQNVINITLRTDISIKWWRSRKDTHFDDSSEVGMCYVIIFFFEKSKRQQTNSTQNKIQVQKKIYCKPTNTSVK